MIKSVKLTVLVLSALLFLMNSANSQNIKYYDSAWKKVDNLVQKRNLPKSALEEVTGIYTRAKKEGQEAQLIKALVYIQALQAENRENAGLTAIQTIEKEAAMAKEPVASILKSMLAGQYWSYFQQHRWQLYNRTNTQNFKKEDIATWTAADLHQKIAALFLSSIQNKALLKATRLDTYDPVITKGNARHLRPTLYDLLAHRALDYFKNDERDISKPAYAFEIVQPEAFAPAPAFATHRFTTRDTASLHHKALEIYQELIRFHLPDASPEALLDVDIERIQFAYSNAVMENKEDLYKQALENITAKHPPQGTAAQAWYLLAVYYKTGADGYDPHKDTTHRYDALQARNLLKKVVADSGVKSQGWAASYNLLKELEAVSFSYEVEKVNLPEAPFRALVNYKNMEKLYFRIIRSTDALKQALENDNNGNYWNLLTAAAPQRSWQQALPPTADLQQHAVEVKVEALPAGDYILLASSDDRFSAARSILGARLFYVSAISYIRNGDDYFVLHRQSGQPLPRAAIQVWQMRYDYQRSRNIREKAEAYTTDGNGLFTLKRQKAENGSYNYLLDISYNGDRLFTDDLTDRYYYNNRTVSTPLTDNDRTFTYLFTDRSLYRPGQTLYFKGISVISGKEEADKKVRSGYTALVYLYNANAQRVDSLKLTTNEFGSFNGKFTLPQNGLNGVYTLQIKGNRGTASINVEEYKRPKFYVDFEKIRETYKAGDSVTLTGFAKAYAGNNIDGAKVAYRVVRQPRFIYTWYSRWWQPPAREMEIAHGELTTGIDGKFTIRFRAIPDKKIDPKFDPIFDYRIYADITDAGGETRSGSETVSAGYKSLFLQLNIDNRLPVDSLQKLSIRTENIAGEYIPAQLRVSFTRLIPENRLIRRRYWAEPDQFVLSKAEFVQAFPHDEYAAESDYTTWARGETVYTKSDSSRINGEWAMANSDIKSGFYAIEVVTKDKEGKEVKDIRYTEVFDAGEKALTRPEYLWAKGSGPIQPGEKTAITIGTSAPEVYLIKKRTDKAGEKSATYSYESLNREKKSFEAGATEEDRGGYGLSFAFVKDNRYYQYNDIVQVPWTNKELQIEYTTFRDKTLPGSEEKWKVKISGYKSEKVAAEMLAGMYDASLDQFNPHNWNKPAIWSHFYNSDSWRSQNFEAVQSDQKWKEDNDWKYFNQVYDKLNLDNQSDVVVVGYGARRKQLAAVSDGIAADMAAPPPMVEMKQFTPPVIAKNEEVMQMAIKMPGIQVDSTPVYDPNDVNKIAEYKVLNKPDLGNNANGIPIQIRKNFNETAFFFPELRTDADGNIEFSFTAPEALTQWKLQTLAHTKNLAFGLDTKELVTQKELMVQPNAPRFLRQGDAIELSAKIVNLSDSEVTGQAQLELFDAATNQPVDGWFTNMFPNQYFTVAGGQSGVVKFPVKVPHIFTSALQWRITARAGNVGDGEESSLPVLTNKTLVTETLPLPMRGSGTRAFSFEKLLNSGNSETLQHQALTVEYTSNPAWYAVQALPYLMEYPYECAEQTWNRYYANSLAGSIVAKAPRIKAIFERWKTLDTTALLSNLQKNEELKTALLEETPWVVAAKSETQQKKNIALLFDMVRMSAETAKALDKLKQSQSSNGGFVWFKGGPDNRYITQYIVTGIGHLKKLAALGKEQEADLKPILATAIPYLDRKLKEDYDYLIKNKAKLASQQIGYMQIQYLYMRSFFPEYEIPKATQTAYNYYRSQAVTYWMPQGKYMQGMIALALSRTGDAKTPGAILASLKETAINNEEQGMYWKDVRFGYSWFWWHAPVETQALLIETFAEIGKDNKTVDDLKTWLVKNKQTNNWPTTKATAEACYALLLQGTDWLSNEPSVTIQLGNTTIKSGEEKTEAGTGYFKKAIAGAKVAPEMGKIKVTVQQAASKNSPSGGGGASWGAVYWQYFEDLDKITAAATPLQLSKKLFVETTTDRGPVLTPVGQSTEMHTGDKIKVRIELRVDRDMEYVHMKDMRAAALEPVNVLSGYQWQDGLGYYQSTKDASTNFFFDYLRKGTYVFEYPLFVTHTGNFSNGITTIQCMYAPEFTAHSEGVRITVSERGL